MPYAEAVNSALDKLFARGELPSLPKPLIVPAGQESLFTKAKNTVSSIGDFFSGTLLKLIIFAIIILVILMYVKKNVV